MRNAGFTKQERSFIALMRILAVLLLGTGLVFIFLPDVILTYFTEVGGGLFGWRATPLVLGGERFWLVLAIAHVLTLAYLCFLVQQNFLRNAGYARPVIFSKFISGVGFFLCLLLDAPHFIYLVGGIVDGTLFLLTWRMYASAINSRT